MNLKLRKYRESLNMTQADLAKKIGKSFRTIQSWERGESYPNTEAIWSLCEVFNTDPNDFLGWYDEHPREDGIPISLKEAEILSCYRNSSPDDQRYIERSAQMASGDTKKESQNNPSQVEGIA